MARYTDIDLLIDKIEDTNWYHISKQGELVSGANSRDDIPLYKHSDIKEVLNNAPIADVVPRSEYEIAIKEVSRLSQEVLLNIESTEFEVREARVKLAREIFAEIDTMLNKIQPVYFVDAPLANYRHIVKKIAELKKKYTEDKE